MARFRAGKLFSVFFFMLLAGWNPTQAFETNRRSFTLENLLNARIVQDVKISPDGNSIIYELRNTDLKNNNYYSELWMIRSISNPVPEKIKRFKSTTSSYTLSQPQWSPDGQSIAYFDTVENSTEIWRYLIKDKKVEQLSALNQAKMGFDSNSYGPASDFKWSLDSDSLLFTAATPSKAEKPSRALGTVADIYWPNSGTGEPQKLWLLNVKTKKAMELTDKTIHVREFDWSPDGKQVVFTASKVSTWDSYMKTDIYLLALETGKSHLLFGQPGMEMSPRWSPDGKWIAFCSGKGKEDWFQDCTQSIISVSGGKPVYFTQIKKELGGSGSPLAWSRDSKKLYLNMWYQLSSQIFELSIENGAYTRITDNKNYYSNFSFSKDLNTLAFMQENPVSSAEVSVSPIPSFSPKSLTNLNPELQEIPKGEWSIISWKSADQKFNVSGVLIKPPGFQSNQKYPLLVVLEGGPDMVITTFNFSQLYPVLPWADQGYLIFVPNTRGRGGYGADFLYAIRDYHDYHPGPYGDMISGVDYLISQGIVDSERMGVVGFSYGSSLGAWTVTQTNRFKAASLGDGSTDLVMAGFRKAGNPTSVAVWKDFCGLGLPFDPSEMEELMRQSPIYGVQNVKTPCLLEYGSESIAPDHGKSFYQSLVAFNVPVEFIVYPRTGHGIEEPQLLQDSYEWNTEWFNFWVLGKSSPRTEKWKNFKTQNVKASN